MSPTTVVRIWYRSLSSYEKTSLWLAVGLTLATRILFVIASLVHHPVAIEVDTYRYIAIANEPGFARWFDLNDPAGYPILLKLTFTTLASYAGILFLQAVLSTATIVLLFVLGRQLVLPKWNRLSALLAALSPLSMFFSSQLMTETSFAFFFLLSIVLLVKNVARPKRNLLLFIGGLSMSFATLIRPSSIVSIIFLIPIIGYYAFEKKTSWSAFASFAAGCLLLIGLYATGLKLKYNYFGISVKGPTTLSIYYGIPIMQSAGYSDHAIDSTMQALPTAEQYLDPKRPDHIDGEYFAHQHNALFLKLLAKHPIDVLKVHVLGLTQMLAWPPIGLFQLTKHFGELDANSQLKEMDFQSVFEPIVRFQFSKVIAILRARLGNTPKIFVLIWCVSTLIWIFVLGCAIFGALVFVQRLRHGTMGFEYWLLMAAIGSYVFLVPQVAAGSRFRMPIEPLLILCAVLLLNGISKRRTSKKLSR